MPIDYQKGRGGGEYLDIRPGDGPIELKVLDSGYEPSKFGGDNVVHTVDVGGETLKWRLNVGANIACEKAEVSVGDVVRVARGADQTKNGRTVSDWTVEVIDDPPY